jgi:plasmid stabilization system protein ParE
MNYHVVFSPEAGEHLVALYHYIADVASPDIAARYTEDTVIKVKYQNSLFEAKINA